MFTETQVVEIVGVVRTAKYRTVREEPQITIYLPLAQRPLTGLTLHARVVGNTAAATAALLRALHDIDSRVPVDNVGLLQDHINARLSNERVLSVLSILFASLAVLVACAGLYGLVSWMKTHLSTTTDEVVARLSKDWEGDVRAYDKVYEHILKMADALTDGIVKQFPDKSAA